MMTNIVHYKTSSYSYDKILTRMSITIIRISNFFHLISDHKIREIAKNEKQCFDSIAVVKDPRFQSFISSPY